MNIMRQFIPNPPKYLKTVSITLTFLIFLFSSADYSFTKDIKERLGGSEKLSYKVSFNGIPSGYIDWYYLGRQEVEGVMCEVLSVNSDTNIFKIIDLTSEEKVFLDVNEHLPVMVEREGILFGKKYIIKEMYDQDKGLVRLKRINDKQEESIIYQDKPIHNILALLYFFPENMVLKKNEWMVFNLPTQKVRIKMTKETMFKVNGGKKSAYFLIGRGAKRFNLWLDKETRLPLRIDFILPLGKVVIRRVSI